MALEKHSKTGKYRFRFSTGRKGKKISSPWFEFKKEALDWRNERFIQGNTQERNRSQLKVSINKIREDFLKTKVELSKKHREELFFVISSTCEAGDIQFVEDFTLENVEQWIGEIRESRTNETLYRYIGHLKQFSKYMTKRAGMSSDPLVDIWQPRKSVINKEQVIRAYTVKQLETLLNVAKERIPERYLYFLVLAETGLRKMEAANLEEEDFKVDKGVLIIRPKPHLKFFPKSEHAKRAIPISSRLGKHLPIIFKQRKSTTSRLFSSRSGKLLSESGLNRSFNIIKGDPSVQKITPNWNEFYLHCLRHTWITHILENGVPPHRVKQWAGHSSLSVTEKYISYAGGDEASIEHFKKAEARQEEKRSLLVFS